MFERRSALDGHVLQDFALHNGTGVRAQTVLPSAVSRADRSTADRSAADRSAAVRSAADDAAPAVTLSLRHPHALLQISAFAQSIDEAGARLSEVAALKLPAPNRYSGDAQKSLRATGAGIWQLAGDPATIPDAASLRANIAGVGTVVDLSHARAVLQLSGRAAAKTLAKHCGLDLYSAAFPTGAATNTRFGHLGMTLARIDDAPTFELMVFRGYAAFVFESLAASAAEFGLRIRF